MNRCHMLLTPVIFAFAIGMQAQNASPAATGSGEVHEVKITAKKYEYDPNPIHVKKGERVRLIVTALDHDHGFKIEAFHVEQEIKKGTSSTVEFTADQAGTFPFHCSKFCGMGHGKMKGTIVVEE